MQFSARHLTNGTVGQIADTHLREQSVSLCLILLSVATHKTLLGLQAREYHLLDGYRKAGVELAHLRHITNSVVVARAQSVGKGYGARVGHSSHNSLHERRFSASVGAYDADEVVVVNIQVDTLKGGIAIVSDADAAKRKYYVALFHRELVITCN